MLEARVRDFRIDSRLQRVCGNYLMELCGGMDSYELEDTDLNNCLQVRAGGAYSCEQLKSCWQLKRECTWSLDWGYACECELLLPATQRDTPTCSCTGVAPAAAHASQSLAQRKQPTAAATRQL